MCFRQAAATSRPACCRSARGKRDGSQSALQRKRRNVGGTGGIDQEKDRREMARGIQVLSGVWMKCGRGWRKKNVMAGEGGMQLGCF